MAYLANEEQVNYLANEVARAHVLRLLTELEQWLIMGKSVEEYILIKRHLFTQSNN